MNTEAFEEIRFQKHFLLREFLSERGILLIKNLIESS